MRSFSKGSGEGFLLQNVDLGDIFWGVENGLNWYLLTVFP